MKALKVIYHPQASADSFANVQDVLDSLGAYASGWTTLKLPSGGVINWASGDVTITHSSNALAFAGASSGYSFDALINLTGGQIAFPATQNPSADANTLDDYEEGSWTPVLTFATPGDLTVAYSAQVGRYRKIGSLVTVWFTITTSTFTHTTASGSATITGLPFTVDAALNARGGMAWQGITKANYTQVAPTAVSSTAGITLSASGSGQAIATIATGDMPTGGTVALAGSVSYIVA